MTLKKITALLAALVFALAVTACNNNNEATPTPTAAPTTAPAASPAA